MPQPRKPTALRALGGARARDLRDRANEPTPPIGVGDPPPHLDEHGRAAWSYIRAQLEGCRVLTAADALAVEGACAAYADLRQTQAIIAKEGRVYSSQTRDGGLRRYAHPAVAMAADADRRLLGWLSRLGMTPADRSRVAASPDLGNNPFAHLNDSWADFPVVHETKS